MDPSASSAETPPPPRWLTRMQSLSDAVTQYDVTQEGWEAVHAAFGLTYASYLVLPRSVMQMMPNAWQLRFVALLNELHATFDCDGAYLVRKRGDHGRFVDDPLRVYRHPDYAALYATLVTKPTEAPQL